jgi:cytochrome c peroxidase
MRARATALLLVALPGCGADLDTEQVLRDEMRKLADPGPPPADASNRHVGDPLAIALGHAFYFDDDFSGYGTEEDVLLEPVSIQTRAARGERLRVSCATCHDLDRGGVDPGEAPFGNRVSVAAGVYDVNSQPTINAAYNKLVYWNGRSDSLWTQVLSVTENRVSMFGSRLRIAWRIADAYRQEYEAAFPDDPLPAELDSILAQAARLEPDGSCTLGEGGVCPEPYCHQWLAEDDVTYCLPRFPLEGMPGFEVAGTIWHCNWGTGDPLQPFRDAFDCMELEDRVAINRIFVNFAKAIAAYEYTLISVDTPFDAWVASDFTSDDLGASAQRGARLFVGKAACTACHSGPMMTDDLVHNIGVPQRGEFVPTLDDCPADGWCDCVSDDTSRPRFCFPNGARDGLRILQDWPFRRDSAYSDDIECANHRVLHIDAGYAEANPDECGGLVGHYVVPVAPDTVAAWRTPGLRNVSLTAPYMHNGFFDTLEEVVEHYNKGAGDFLAELIGELDEDITELDLTPEEEADLVEFMKALEGPPLPEEIRARPDIPPASPFPAVQPFAVE